MLAFPLLFGMSSIASHFVPLFYGKGFDKVVPLICIISPITVLIGLSNVIGTQYLLPTKQQNKYTISVVAGALVNFILNFILIRYYKSIGASIATVIAELAVTTVQFILVKDQIKFKDVIKISYKYFIASLIMFGCSMVVGYLIKNNLLSIVIQVIVSGVVYFTLLLLMKDKFIKEGIEKILIKLKLRKSY